MTSTRDFILKTLQSQQQCTITELAAIVGIDPISIRHHISKLEAAYLISSKEERHGVGRPRRVYSLTEKGSEQFPTRYVSLANRLLEGIKERLPLEMANSVFSAIGKEIATDIITGMNLESLSIEERLDLVRKVLMAEGFTVEWYLENDTYFIKEVSCPYLHVGQEHPEVCSIDKAVISTMISVPAEKIHCILEGDNQCTYTIPRSQVIHLEFPKDE